MLILSRGLQNHCVQEVTQLGHSFPCFLHRQCFSDIRDLRLGAWRLFSNRLRDLTATFNLSCAFKAITLRHRDSVCKFILLLGLFTLHLCNSNSLCIGARWHFDRSVSEIMSRYEDISAPRSRKSFTLLTTNYVYMKIISISLSAILIHAELIMPLITIPSRIHRDQMS